MRQHYLTILLVLLPITFSTMVFADEVWDTNSGRVIYQEDQGPTAVWRYGSADNVGMIYILGLAKVYTNRTQYDGYWAKNNAKKACDSERIGINGVLTKYWGRFQVRFLDKDFPSRWEAVWSYCHGKAEPFKIEAKPVVAQ